MCLLMMIIDIYFLLIALQVIFIFTIYLDTFQIPLQPLRDNLQSQTYECFEEDNVKYDCYEKAVDLAGKGRWAKAHGPMASAAATLLDFEWEIPAINEWVSPDLVPWSIDYADHNLEGMLREVLTHYFQMSIWHKAKACDTGEVPDLTEVRALLKRGKAASDHRFVYWLVAVVQGGADTSFSRYASFGEGLVKCACCGEIVEGNIWEHLSYFCRVTLEDDDLIDAEIIMRGQEDLRAGSRQSLWLRGLRPLVVGDPLASTYSYYNSWGDD